MPRLDDKIRQLCAEAIAATERRKMEAIVRNLRASLKEHTQRLRRNVKFPISERRAS